MASRPPGRLKIYLLIPNHPGPTDIDPQFLRCFEYQSRCRLPTVTSFIGPVRTIVDSINLAPQSCKLRAELLMNPRHFIVSSEPAPNNGLVGYNHDSKSSLLNFSKGCLNARKNLQLLRSFNIVLPLSSQNTIPVEKDCPSERQ